MCFGLSQDIGLGLMLRKKIARFRLNAFDMMAKDDELNFLIENSKMAIEIWTAKEAVQKAEKLGMNLNPRDINLDNYRSNPSSTMTFLSRSRGVKREKIHELLKMIYSIKQHKL